MFVVIFRQVSTIPARNFPGTNLTVSCRFLVPVPVRCISTILPGETCTGWLGSSAATSTVRSKSAAGGQKDSRGWSRWWCRGKVSCKSDNLRRIGDGDGRVVLVIVFFPGRMEYNECNVNINIYIYVCSWWGREHVEMKLAHLESSLFLPFCSLVTRGLLANKEG